MVKPNTFVSKTIARIEKITLNLISDILFEQYNKVIYTLKHIVRRPPSHTYYQLHLLLPIKCILFPANKWFETIVQALKTLTKVSIVDQPQPFDGIITIKAIRKNIEHEISFDFRDFPSRINIDGLAAAMLYFKMQYQKEGYNNNKIIPGLYVPGSISLYHYLSSLRKLRLQQKRHDVYGRFGNSFAQEIRGKALQLLNSQKKFKYTGEMALIRYSRHLRETAQSKVCIDLPGNGPICFRLIEYLAVGACIIGPPHEAVFDPPLQDGIHIKFCKPDLSDMVDLCEYYLNNDSARNKMADNAMAFFDNYLSMEKIAQYYLEKINRLIS